MKHNYNFKEYKSQSCINWPKTVFDNIQHWFVMKNKTNKQNLSLFENEMIVYIQSSQVSTKKVLEMIK